MTKQQNHSLRPTVSESQKEQRRTLQARAKLYRLIATFRREAKETTNPETRSLLEFAAETIAGLVSELKHREEQTKAQDKSDNVP